MKIAILTPGLPPLYNGGTEIATVEIARYSARAGHKVHVVALDGTSSGTEPYRAAQDGFTVHRIRSVPLPYIYGVAAIPNAVATLIKIRPDVIHAQGSVVGVPAMLASAAMRAPFILYGRGEIYTNWFGKSVITKVLMARAHRVIAQTDAMRSRMKEYLDRDIEVIPNGIDTEKFGKMTKKDARDALHLPQDAKIVLSVGRCRPEKNLRDFVMAADLVGATFIVVGGGPQLAELMSLSGSRVTFAGNVDNNTVPTYMSAADVLVNTSLSEGFPMSILEGMAAGLPIVAPRVCGIPEIVEDGVNGILTNRNDYRNTAEAIHSVLTRPEWASQVSRNNLERVRQYSWESVVERLYESNG